MRKVQFQLGHLSECFGQAVFYFIKNAHEIFFARITVHGDQRPANERPGPNSEPLFTKLFIDRKAKSFPSMSPSCPLGDELETQRGRLDYSVKTGLKFRAPKAPRPSASVAP